MIVYYIIFVIYDGHNIWHQMEIETIIYDMVWCILYNMIYYNHLNWLQVSSSSDGDADSGVDETTQGL